MKKPFIQFPFWLALCLVATLSASSLAQEKKAHDSASCNQESALAILEEQIAATRTFDDQVQRIAVLIHASDLLWPYQQEKARAGFAEAFELAVREYRDKGDEPRHEGVGLAIGVPDQRYTVIGAIAKRDLAWAQKLTRETLSDQQNEALETNTKSAQQQTRTAEKLLSVPARSRLPIHRLR